MQPDNSEADTSKAAFSECAAATDDLPLRQGDVIERFGELAEADTRHGIVVTADCDIAQSKHNNIVSYVPLFALGQMLTTFYVPRRLEKALANSRRELTRLATQMRRQAVPESSAFSEEAIDSWLQSVEPRTIVDTIGSTDQRLRQMFLTLALGYCAGVKAIDSSNLSQCVDALAILRAQSSGDTDKARDKTWDDINSYLKSLPGDMFFISSIGDSVDLRDGYVAYLRMLRELHSAHIALRPADLRSVDTRAKRIARLRSPYVYRLTQQLASVFSSIGLPTDYEKERDRLASILKAPKGAV